MPIMCWLLDKVLRYNKTITITLAKCLLCASHGSKHFKGIQSLKTANNLRSKYNSHIHIIEEEIEVQSKATCFSF